MIRCVPGAAGRTAICNLQSPSLGPVSRPRLRRPICNLQSAICNLLLLTLVLGSAAADPSYYHKQATWQETLVASREAMAREAAGRGTPVPLPDFGAGPFTISAWVRTRAGGTILAKAPAEGNWAPQGKTFFVRGGRLCYDIGWVGTITSERSVGDDAWHHVAITGPGDYRMFIDGRPDAQGSLGAEKDPAGFLPRIGATSSNFPEQSGFSGLLDEVRVYRGRLTPAEIGALYEKPDGDVQAGALLARWRFDGDPLDMTGHRNDGTLQGGRPAYAPGKAGQALALDGRSRLELGAAPVSVLWEMLRRDFPDVQSQQEMAWEQEDRLHEGEWQGPAALAGRYAGAMRLTSLAARVRTLAQNARAAGDLQPIRELYYRDRKMSAALARWQALNPKALRLAIADLSATYGPRYPGAALAGELERLEQPLLQAAEKGSSPEAEMTRAVEGLEALRYRALVRDNPLFSFGRILFIKRKTYQSSHYYTDYIDGCRYYGGNLCILDLKSGKVTEVVPQMGKGIFGKFDLSFDGRKVLFDWKEAPDKGFRIFEVGVDGSGLRQITFPPPNEQELAHRFRTLGTPSGVPYLSGTDDMHPCYLPDGDIAFVTTRCEKGILCDAPDVLTTTTLYRMDRNGQGMHPLSFNSVSEAVPTVSSDGRILYTRWEYVDKGGSACKCIWAMRPDGTDTVEIYGNNISHPVTFIDCRDIPGEPDSYVCVGAPHMPLGVGAILRLNTSLSLRTLAPMTNLTPEIYTPDEFGFRHLRDGKWEMENTGPLCREPYPLSRKYFLMAYNADQPWNAPAGYGIYLLDEFGNRVPIYRDPEFSCWEPFPLRARPVPPVLPAAAEPKTAAQKRGTLVLQDVYQGMTGIQRGRVKYLRVMEDCPRPWDARRYWAGDTCGGMQEHIAVSWGGHLAPKIEHGIVPVEKDGSAYFQVPADKNVFLQALDENYMELQRMRTFINLRPGEQRGCVGCHEEKRVAPPPTYWPLALRRPPSQPAPQPGEVVPRAMHFPTDVQPVLDRRCVSCHSAANPNKIDLSGTPTDLFSVSYENLMRGRWAGNVIDEIGASGTGGKHAHVEAADPLVYGSHTSKLVALLQQGHHGVKLTQEEFIRLVTWMDANAPYYGSYDGRRGLRYKEMPGWRPAPKAGPECTAWSGLPVRPPGHPFLCTDNGRNMVYQVSAEGKIVWEYPATFGQDVWRLPNGNVLFSHLHGVQEVTPDKKVVWEYQSPAGTEVHNCQPLPDGAVMVCECGTRRIIEIDRQGKIRKEIRVETNTPTVHMQFRIARKLDNGHYLVAFVGDRLVREFDGDGKTVRTIPVPGDVFVALRLPNGNTLIGCGDGHKVLEVDPNDKVVWSIDENEIPGHPLRFVAGLERLPNGNTVVCNWGGHGHVAEQPLIFEVTPDKKVVWQVDDYGLFRTISNVCLLDVKGAVR